MATLQPQQTLAQGRYSVQRPLTQGGMGAIYLATDHEAFERPVVIKALLGPDELADDPEQARQRFLREARTLAALRYPTIPQIYSYFQDGAQAYIAMEYIAGEDLSQRLSQHDPGGDLVPGRPHPLSDVLRWGIELCRTLEYLELREPPVIHQDIKPANLIRSSDNRQLYLVDFGAARMRVVNVSGGNKTQIFGTPGYAAPEQFQGHSEPRSDIYALAATLYHLVTDDDPSEHLFSFPRLQHLGYFGNILHDALQTDPQRRPSAAELRARFEALLRPEGGRALPAPDGMQIYSEQDLTVWCERNWEQARDWLYGNLPDQIMARWVQIELGRSLRAIAERNDRDRNAGLDAALALLDPNDFGRSAPALKADRSLLNLGEFGIDELLLNQMTIHNSGRRYVHVNLTCPPWLKVEPLALSLAPGERRPISFRSVFVFSKGGRLAGRFQAVHQGQALVAVDLLGAFSARQTIPWRTAGPNTRAYKLIMLTAMMAVIVVMLAITILQSFGG